jgi:aminomethyltransferase
MAGLRQLPLADRHVALGARFGEFAGWEMPLWYTGAIEEHLAVRNAAGVFDISHMGRFRVTGMQTAQALAGVFTRDPARLKVGASAYGFACNESGGIVDDLIIYRLGEKTFIVICNAANARTIGGLIDWAATPHGLVVDDLQEEDTVLFAVQGPAAVGLVARLLGDEVGTIARRTCRELRVDGTDYLLMRTGYTGEDGFEVICSVKAGETLLGRLLDGGECRPCGLAARDSLRLEASLALHGVDIDETTTPWEAGLSWAVELEHQFRGREALLKTKDSTERRLACMVADAPGVIRGHSEVFQQGEQVGMVTSGGHSPMLGRSIAMGYLPRRLAREGNELSVTVRERRLPCHTVRRPFYSRPEA